MATECNKAELPKLANITNHTDEGTERETLKRFLEE
jgi:hypothetical protein